MTPTVRRFAASPRRNCPTGELGPRNRGQRPRCGRRQHATRVGIDAARIPGVVAITAGTTAASSAAPLPAAGHHGRGERMNGLRLTLRSRAPRAGSTWARRSRKRGPEATPARASPVATHRRRAPGPCRSATSSRSTARPTAPRRCWAISPWPSASEPGLGTACCVWKATSAIAPVPEMSGGRLEFIGNAGHSTGEGMSGGLVNLLRATPAIAPAPRRRDESAA